MHVPVHRGTDCRFHWNVKRTRAGCIRSVCKMKKMKQKGGSDVTVAVSVLALIVAIGSLYQAYRSTDIAEDARDAVRLEQRAWLSYRKITLAARSRTDESWEDREPMQGDYARIRLLIGNTGKTPATNVRFLHQIPMLLPDGTELKPPVLSESEWASTNQKNIVVPGTETRFQDVQFRLNREARYVNGTHVLFLWVRMEYCDVAHRTHWTQAGVMHRYGEDRDDFWTLSQSISPSDSGEPDYERCPR